MRRVLPLLALLLPLSLPTAARAYNVMFANCGGARWSSADQPVSWYLNQNGYSKMSITQVESIFQSSMAVWAAPCCSSFSSTYLGRSTSTATSSPGKHVFQFIESGWPSTLGDVNSTIGVTPVQVWSDCTMADADIVFNAVGFTFVNGWPSQQNDADLMSIAVHEMGHFLGLDHSMISGVSMYPSYSNGIVERDLHQDDIDGVCSLYPGSCTCQSATDCAQGEACVNSACVPAPCASNAACQAPLVCNTASGQCVPPPCSVDADCSAGFACSAGTCVRSATCLICEPCTQNSDCGASGMCVSFGAGGVCTQTCGQSACPGNSTCFTVPDGQGNTFDLCLNADAGTNPPPCPATYVCDDPCLGVSCAAGQRCDPGSGSCVVFSCNGLGNDCANNGAACTADNDICIGTAASAYCSCRCASDAECGAGSCVDFDTGAACAGGNCACVTPTAPDLCAGVTCPTGQRCDPTSGSCQGGDPCASVSCPPAASCDAAKGCCTDARGLCWSDVDSDGVSDGMDNCPRVANSDQADANSNGVGDVCEVGGDGGGGATDAGNPGSDGGASADGGGSGGGQDEVGCFCGQGSSSPTGLALFLSFGLLLGITRRRR